MESLKDKLKRLEIPDLMNCIESLGYIDSKNADRNQSTVIKMLKFHNYIKGVLITNITDYYYSTKKKEISLLDIAVGRGGDLFKWKNAYITNVFGFDISSESIKEANERLLNNDFNKMNIKLLQGVPGSESINTEIYKFLLSVKQQKFDLVSCQFALHYFFKDQATLRQVLKLVSDSLYKGGYFFGTTVNGGTLMDYFEQLPGEDTVIKKNLFRIERFFSKNFRKKFGNKYSFTIYDSTYSGNYFNKMGTSTEYLVLFDELNKIAMEYSLVPVDMNFFENKLNGGYTTSRSNIINFSDLYKDKFDLSDSEKELSFLNSTFVFKKIV